MDRMPASIFNDVIGPVMRGPSSSHVAGAARIAAVVRQSVGGGMIEMRRYDGFDISLCGDFYEVLVKFPHGGAAAMKSSLVVAGSAPDFATALEGSDGSLLSLKYS